MEILMDDECFFGSDGLRKHLNISDFHLFDGLKLFQEQIAGFRPDARNVVEFAVERVLGAFVAVERDGVAVHLVLNAGEHVEKFAICFNTNDLRRISKEKFVGAMAVVFGESGDRNLEPEFVFHHLAHHRHLALSAVSDDEVG